MHCSPSSNQSGICGFRRFSVTWMYWIISILPFTMWSRLGSKTYIARQTLILVGNFTVFFRHSGMNSSPDVFSPSEHGRPGLLLWIRQRRRHIPNFQWARSDVLGPSVGGLPSFYQSVQASSSVGKPAVRLLAGTCSQSFDLLRGLIWSVPKYHSVHDGLISLMSSFSFHTYRHFPIQ